MNFIKNIIKLLLVLLLNLAFIDILYSQQSFWNRLPNAPTALRFDDLYFINQLTGWIVDIQGRLYKTTSGGISFQLQFADNNGGFRSVGFHDSLVGFIGTLVPISVLFKTTNGGINWSLVQNIPAPVPAGICGISIVNSSVIYGCGRYDETPRVIKSTNRGNNWITYDMSTYASTLIDCYFTSVDSGIVVGGLGSTYQNRRGIVLFTSNGGSTWVNRITTVNQGQWGWKISFPSRNVGYVSLERAGGNNQTYFLKTTNGGISWEEKLFLNSYYDEEGIGFVSNLQGWIGGQTYPWETIDGGNTWYQINYGLGSSINRIRFLSDTLGYAAGGTIYKYSTDSIIGISSQQNNLPSVHRLGQNFPNPFNPSTKIKYEIGKSLLIRIVILDIIGRQLNILVDGFRPPGVYEIEWDGKDKSGIEMPSGVYFYRLESEKFNETKKMTLLK